VKGWESVGDIHLGDTSPKIQKAVRARDRYPKPPGLGVFCDLIYLKVDLVASVSFEHVRPS